MGPFYHFQPPRAIVRLFRRCLLLIAVVPAVALAQGGDSLNAPSPPGAHSRNYWPLMAAGAATSILAHEAGHVVTSYAVGAHPSFGFNDFRPTVYSGVSTRTAPRKQFYFSAAGLTVQSLIDEAILDIPHSRGSAFERGVLGGGIGTTLFYLTIGRWGSVSDVTVMARTHVMTKTDVTLVFGSVMASQVYRIWRDKHYVNFF